MNINETLEYIKEKGRMLDYFLIKNLFGDFKKKVLEELLKYQNDDFGFGNALEPDMQMPHSSVLATNVAITVLGEIECDDKDLLASICEYYITQFDYEKRMFEFAPIESENHPHAVWWNYDNRDSFGYYNPTPEVLGFLLKHKFLHNFDIDGEVEYCLNRIKTEFLNEVDEHSLYSIIKFSKELEDDELNLVIEEAVKKVITLSKDKWLEYSPQPYKLLSKDMTIFKEYEKAYNNNIDFILETNVNSVWYPEWQWFQYDDVFEEKAKYQWMGYLTFERIKLLLSENKIKQMD